MANVGCPGAPVSSPFGDRAVQPLERLISFAKSGADHRQFERPAFATTPLLEQGASNVQRFASTSGASEHEGEPSESPRLTALCLRPNCGDRFVPHTLARVALRGEGRDAEQWRLDRRQMPELRQRLVAAIVGQQRARELGMRLGRERVELERAVGVRQASIGRPVQSRASPSTDG